MYNDLQLRSLLQDNLQPTIDRINIALKGVDLGVLKPVLSRIGRGKQLPHWCEGLKANNTLPNVDDKTIGSVVEMLLVAVLETYTFKGLETPPLRINPARGVDLPGLNLGVKSPSENFCASKPWRYNFGPLFGTVDDDSSDE